jgi:hypothetical protein
MSGDDTGGRDTLATGNATVCDFCRDPARNHDVYRSVESSISTVTVCILLWNYRIYRIFQFRDSSIFFDIFGERSLIAVLFGSFFLVVFWSLLVRDLNEIK